MSFLILVLVVGAALVALKTIGDEGGDQSDFFSVFFGMIILVGLPLVILVQCAG